MSFLERFAFKNPKKKSDDSETSVENEKPETKVKKRKIELDDIEID